MLDADIRNFYDSLSHEWTLKFIAHRVADRRILRLIQKWLMAGVSEIPRHGRDDTAFVSETGD
jgi:RNA-directed DNA polymerase